MSYIERDFKEAYIRMKERALQAESDLEYTKALLGNAVQEYPVASGLYVDADGQAGYGSLKAARLYLRIEPNRTPQDTTDGK